MADIDVEEVLKNLSLAEKVDLLSGIPRPLRMRPATRARLD